MGLMNDRTKSQRKATIPTKEEKATTRIAKIVPQLGCVSQYSDALDSQARKSRGNPMQKILRSIRRIQFTKSTLRQASIREKKGPSLGNIQVKNPHQRSPNAVKFEELSQEETERQQRCPQSNGWNLVKNIFKLKERRKPHSIFPRRYGYYRLRQQKSGGNSVCNGFRSEYAYGH